MQKWKIKDEIVLFPKNWNKDKVLKWVNAKHIRVCPKCSKIDVSYKHFNDCNPSKQKAIQMNRDMNNY